jgi:hypothetical protein
MSEDELKKNKYYTNVEIDPSLIFGVMGNQIIYPENNPFPRNAFSCGQSKQAVSVYHSNYQMRMDKMGVILNYGQIPLIKSKYLELMNKEQQPYGVNTIVAIMAYTGYNVEDAILINKGSIERGLFNTTYFSMYEAHEESSRIGGGKVDSKFANIEKQNVSGIKPGYDYSLLDEEGLIRENTPLHDKVVVIGKITSNPESKDVYLDDSVTPKKGQLGIVDKSFITEGETGTKIAKVRIREERIPAIGDKMASRAGQKGTIGLIIPEDDMPFTSDGLRPDLIINPHAIPSRMTVGQLIESLFGKACLTYGAFGDCTAFYIKGSNYDTYGPMLTKAGFNNTGNQLMYNGMTGEQLQADIFIGPTYYMRLKHMVKDKINYRALGPRTFLTRHTVQGRANDGGLRIGEMERDGILAHGASYFLNESFLKRGDEYFMAVCNKTGCVAIYNNYKNIFFSPFADGPLQYHMNPNGTMNVENISRFGRSFSILRIPYALKLLIQELQVMNVQMRIITDDNIDQLPSMTFSNNIQKLLQVDDNNIEKVISQYISDMNKKSGKVEKTIIIEQEKIEEPEPESSSEATDESSVPWAPGSPAYMPSTQSELEEGEVKENDTDSFDVNNMEKYNVWETPMISTGPMTIDVGDDNLNNLFKTLPENRKKQIIQLGNINQQKELLKNISQSLNEDIIKKSIQQQIKPTIIQTAIPSKPGSILEVQESDLDTPELNKESNNSDNIKTINTETSNVNESPGDVKTINI